MPVTISLAVVDDHSVYRAGIVDLLNSEPGFTVIAEGASASDAKRIAVECAPDVLVMDFCMPGEALTAAREMSIEVPQTRIMILSVVDDDGVAVAAREAGAACYALKGIAGPNLIRAVRSLVTGEALIGRLQAERLLREDAAIARSGLLPRAELSTVDRDLLAIIARDDSTARAADELGLDLPTLMDALLKLQGLLQIRHHRAHRSKPHSDV